MDCEVAIVGAGLAGLTAARQLQQQGLEVLLLDKSRGVGGRVATRRVDGLRLDHGLPYLEARGEVSQRLIESALAAGLIHPWHQFESLLAGGRRGYIAADGINTVAKWLAEGIPIQKSWRVEKIASIDSGWRLTAQSDDTVTAKAVIIAIPAPQALTLLETLPIGDRNLNILSQLRSVTYDPCITVMAGYEANQSEFTAVSLDNNIVSWIAGESSKRNQQPTFVIHTTPDYAAKHIDADDLNAVGEAILNTAAQLTFDWLDQPQWQQVHRWRYAFTRQPLAVTHLTTNKPFPLICCGDWCGGNSIESALVSGSEAATELTNLM